MRFLLSLALVVTFANPILADDVDQPIKHLKKTIELTSQETFDKIDIGLKKLTKGIDTLLPDVDKAEEFLEMDSALKSMAQRVQAIQVRFDAELSLLPPGETAKMKELTAAQGTFKRAVKEKTETALQEIEKVLDIPTKSEDDIFLRFVRIDNKCAAIIHLKKEMRKIKPTKPIRSRQLLGGSLSK